MSDQAFWDQPTQSIKPIKKRKNSFILPLGLGALGVLLAFLTIKKPKAKTAKPEEKPENKEPDLIEREKLRKAMAKELGSKGGKKSVEVRRAKKAEKEAQEKAKQEENKENVIPS